MMNASDKEIQYAQCFLVFLNRIVPIGRDYWKRKDEHDAVYRTFRNSLELDTIWVGTNAVLDTMQHSVIKGSISDARGHDVLFQYDWMFGAEEMPRLCGEDTFHARAWFYEQLLTAHKLKVASTSASWEKWNSYDFVLPTSSENCVRLFRNWIAKKHVIGFAPVFNVNAIPQIDAAIERLADPVVQSIVRAKHGLRQCKKSYTTLAQEFKISRSRVTRLYKEGMRAIAADLEVQLKVLDQY